PIVGPEQLQAQTLGALTALRGNHAAEVRILIVDLGEAHLRLRVPRERDDVNPITPLPVVDTLGAIPVVVIRPVRVQFAKLRTRVLRALRGPAVLDMHPENDVPVIVQEEVAVVLKTVLDLVHVVIEMVCVAVTADARLTNTHAKVVLPGIVTDPQRLTRASGHSTAGPAARVQMDASRVPASLGRHGAP